MTNDQTEEVIQKRWKLPMANQQEIKDIAMAKASVVAESFVLLRHRKNRYVFGRR